jgi:RNA polymerase sigma-70 factor (ECF subfamily)
VRRTPFAAWLFRIAHNPATDLQRRQGRTVSWELLPDLLHPVAAETPEADWLQAEALQRLRGLLAALDPETRHLLALRFAAGLTIPEIAAVLHKSEAATQKKLSRTMHTLQEQYHDTAR